MHARVCEIVAEEKVGCGDVDERRVFEEKPFACKLDEKGGMAKIMYFLHTPNGLFLCAEDGE